MKYTVNCENPDFISGATKYFALRDNKYPEEFFWYGSYGRKLCNAVACSLNNISKHTKIRKDKYFGYIVNDFSKPYLKYKNICVYDTKLQICVYENFSKDALNKCLAVRNALSIVNDRLNNKI